MERVSGRSCLGSGATALDPSTGLRVSGPSAGGGQAQDLPLRRRERGLETVPDSSRGIGMTGGLVSGMTGA